MNVIFLDIDGVLNHMGTKEKSPHSTYGIDAVNLKNFYKIIENVNCGIVLTSTWRKYKELFDYFTSKVNCNLIGVTPNLDMQRGNEIQKWLDSNPSVEKYVILDDDDDMLEHHMKNLVKTHFSVGLTLDDADKAISILKGLT